MLNSLIYLPSLTTPTQRKADGALCVLSKALEMLQLHPRNHVSFSTRFRTSSAAVHQMSNVNDTCGFSLLCPGLLTSATGVTVYNNTLIVVALYQL